MNSYRREARILADIRQEIDTFLDPAVLALAGRDAKACPVQDVAAAESSSEAATGELKLQLLGLQGDGDTLLAKLEDARRENESLRLESERQASHDAAELARLQQQRDELEREGRAKRRRAQEAEGEALQLKGERDALLIERESLQNQMEQVSAEAESRHHRLEEEARSLREELNSSRTALAAATETTASTLNEAANEKALRETIATLEQENASLRLILEQSSPDRQLSSQLRQRHKEYDEELATLRAARAELSQLRAHALKLEQEETALRAALEARSNALHEAEEAAKGATLAKRDLAAFASVATSIIAESGSEGSQSSTNEPSVPPTPLDLNLAWVRLQSEMNTLRQQRSESQLNLDKVSDSERHCQGELQKLRTLHATTQAQMEEQRMELRRTLDEKATLAARVEVLREAIAKRGAGELVPIASGGAAQSNMSIEDLRAKVEAAQRRANDFEQVARAKQSTLDSVCLELDNLRQDHSKLSDIEARARHLQRVNEDLSKANSNLEREQDRLVHEVNAAKREAAAAGSIVRDYDPLTTKVLHFRHGPGASFSSKSSGSSDIDALRSELTAARGELRRLRGEGGMESAMPGSTSTGDLECRQVSRQFERFKKATKKYVQDYREGTFNLLGWKVEMKGEGNSLKWHLTSRFQEGEELVFQLRPGEPNSPAEFDLLSTAWGEQLQGDRHAMAFLQVYRSIPGFLAHITTDLLSHQSIQD